jgi:Ca2+ transporting ATPase
LYAYVKLQGLAILSAVVVVVAVTAINDYQKEQQFRALNDVKEDSQVTQLMPAVFPVRVCLFMLIMSGI